MSVGLDKLLDRGMVILDNVCDYAPGVSTISNAVNLIFQKTILTPEGKEPNSLYGKHLREKDKIECLVLMIPFAKFALWVYCKWNLADFRENPEEITSFSIIVQKEIVREDNSLIMHASQEVQEEMMPRCSEVVQKRMIASNEYMIKFATRKVQQEMLIRCTKRVQEIIVLQDPYFISYVSRDIQQEMFPKLLEETQLKVLEVILTEIPDEMRFFWECASESVRERIDSDVAKTQPGIAPPEKDLASCNTLVQWRALDHICKEELIPEMEKGAISTGLSGRFTEILEKVDKKAIDFVLFNYFNKVSVNQTILQSIKTAFSIKDVRDVIQDLPADEEIKNKLLIEQACIGLQYSSKLAFCLEAVQIQAVTRNIELLSYCSEALQRAAVRKDIKMLKYCNINMQYRMIEERLELLAAASSVVKKAVGGQWEILRGYRVVLAAGGSHSSQIVQQLVVQKLPKNLHECLPKVQEQIIAKDHRKIQFASDDIQKAVVEQNPKNLCYCAITIQEEIVLKDRAKIRFVGESVRESILAKTPALLLFCEEDIQKEVITKDPTKLTFATKAVQMEIVKSLPTEIQRKYLEEHPADFACVSKELQQAILDEVNSIKQNVDVDFSIQSIAMQSLVVETSPSWFEKLTDEAARALLGARPDLFDKVGGDIKKTVGREVDAARADISKASPLVQKIVVSGDPKAVRKCSEDVQKIVLENDPQLLQYFSTDKQEDIARQNLEMFQYCDCDLQKQMIEDDTSKDKALFRWASETVQKELIEEKGDNILYANPNVQKAYLPFVSIRSQLEFLSQKPDMFGSVSQDAQAKINNDIQDAQNNPEKLQYKSVIVQKRAVDQNPWLLQYLSQDQQLAILESNPQLLLHASKDLQVKVQQKVNTVLAEGVEEFQKASLLIQKLVIDKDPGMIQCCGADHRLFLIANYPEMLVHCHDDMQEELAKENPKDRLKFCHEVVQLKIIKEKSEMVVYASDAVKENNFPKMGSELQIEILNKNSEMFAMASETVQKAINTVCYKKIELLKPLEKGAPLSGVQEEALRLVHKLPVIIQRKLVEIDNAKLQYCELELQIKILMERPDLFDHVSKDVKDIIELKISKGEVFGGVAEVVYINKHPEKLCIFSEAAQEKYVSKDPESMLKHASKSFALSFVLKNRGLLQHATSDIQKRVALEDPEEFLCFCSKEVIRSLVTENYKLFYSLPEEFGIATQETLLNEMPAPTQLIIVTEHPDMFEHLGKKEKDVINLEVERVLSSPSAAFSYARPVQRIAIERNPEILQYAIEDLQRIVVKQDIRMLQYANSKVQKEVALENLEENIPFCSHAVQKELALEDSKNNFRYCSSDVQAEVVIAHKAGGLNFILHVSKEGLQKIVQREPEIFLGVTDTEFVLKVLAIEDSVLAYFPEKMQKDIVDRGVRYLGCCSDALQEKLALDKPEDYLKYCSIATQKRIVLGDGIFKGQKDLIVYVSDEALKAVIIESPAILGTVIDINFAKKILGERASYDGGLFFDHFSSDFRSNPELRELAQADSIIRSGDDSSKKTPCRIWDYPVKGDKYTLDQSKLAFRDLKRLPYVNESIQIELIKNYALRPHSSELGHLEKQMDVVKKILLQNGLLLEHFSSDIRGNEQIVRGVVAKSPVALRFASPSVQRNLIKENPGLLGFASDEVRAPPKASEPTRFDAGNPHWHL